MEFSDENEVLATVHASTGRRILGITSLGLLGVLLIYIAIARPPAFGWQLFLLALGFGALKLMDAMRKATSSQIELTPLELRDADGTVVAKVADIQSMDRGVFAFKPSNGFMIKTRTAGARSWRPGLWWRLGRRIGIGGMTPGAQTKFMSEVLATIMATRDTHQ